MLVRIARGLLIAVVGSLVGAVASGAEPEKKPSGPVPQYEFEKIVVPPARADEPVRASLSVKDASNHLEQGALAWTKQRNCVSCHTNGSYVTIRPALTEKLGKPSEEIRTFLVEQVDALSKLPKPQLVSGTRPAQIIYIAAGLAEWDAHVTKKLSPETVSALELMFRIQKKSGEWGSLDCWPPLESSPYQEATVAAMAVATAPGWLDGLTDEKLKDSVARLKTYLRETPPPQDYDRMLLLWTATRMPDLIDGTKKTELVENVWKHQREDGGWSIRTFAKPEEWGSGNRAEKLRAEPEFQNPPSDAHQTALAVIVLRDAGVPASDPRIRRAVTWIKSNQRESGRWWTRSLNTDTFHFITYSATGYSLWALDKCGELPASDGVAAK
ncbi:MAG: hypothetical protein AB7O26_09270 [Planctomycetaceae bacterium]